MSKIVHILYAKNPDEIFNRKSALGSYIFCLSTILNELGGYTICINGMFLDQIRQKDVPTNSSSSNRSLIKKLIPGFIKRLFNEIRTFSKIKQLTKTIESDDNSEVIIEFYSYGSNIGYHLSNKKNIPLMVVYDAPVLDEYFLFNGRFPFFKKKISLREKQTLLQASATIVYSESVKKHVHDKLNKKTKIEIHQNIDFTRFDFIENKLQENNINIGFIGSFLKWHRVDLLLTAFIKLRDQGYAITLFLLGTGAEFALIKQQVDSDKYKHDIIIPGFVDGEMLLNYKRKINIGVMPGSNWYGAPNKIFEYGASKMAVVAPNTPTIKDLFTDKEEILLFENNSADGLYEALKKLCDDRVLMNRIADNLQKKIKCNYSKKNTFDFYNHLITTL